MATDKFDFEKAMARIEKIAEGIEKGNVGLEESIKQFEEGMGLIRRCRQVLDDAELKIQQLEAGPGEGVTVRDAAPETESR